MKKMRSHPLNILENTSHFLILLLLPLLRALLTSHNGFYAWISGAWFDLLVLAFILALGIYSWFVFVFSFDEEGIYLRKGIFFKKYRYLAYHDLTSISVEAPWYYVPFRAVHLRADTDGGSTQLSDFSITIHRDLAKHLLIVAKCPYLKSSDLKRFYIPSNFYIAVFSLITSNSLTGVLYAATSISKAGDIFGKEFRDRIVNEFTRITEILAFGLPPAAAALGYAILFCWLISFLLNLSQHLKFESARRGGILEVSAGLFTKRHYAITVERINFLIIRQSMFSKIFGFFSVFIHCTGYGKKKNEMSVLMPSGEAQELTSNLTMLIPEIPLAKKQIKPKLLNLSRFLIPPLTLILCVLGAGLLGIYFLPKLYNILLFLLIIIEIPSVWWLVIKTYAFFYTGIGTREETVTLYYTFGYQIIACAIPKEKITKVEISQTLFQISTKCCDVTFFTYGEGKRRQKVLNLYLPEVLKLLNLSEEQLGLKPRRKFTLWKEAAPPPKKKKRQTKEKGKQKSNP